MRRRAAIEFRRSVFMNPLSLMNPPLSTAESGNSLLAMTESANGTLELSTRVARGNALVERVGDEFVIIDLASHKVSSLNPAGAVLWDALSVPTTVGQCASSLQAAFDLNEEQAQHDSIHFLGDLLTRGLLVLQ